MSSILIIGANGFIGLKLLQKLTLFDNFYTISKSKLNISNQNNLNHFQFDINKKWLFNKFSDVIVFCATHHQFAKLGPAPINYVNTNISGLVKSLEFAKKNKPKYFIYFSTMAIYGNPKDKIIHEDSSINNPDIYGSSKYFAEKILNYYASYFKILIIRLPGVVDKIMPENRPWISTVVHKLRNNLNVNIYNPNSYFNNIIDVDNISSLIEKVYHSTSKFQYEIINLASSNPMKLIDVIQLLKKNSKSRSQIVSIENSHKNSFIINIDKLKKTFNFVPETTEQILNKILNND